MPRVLAPEPEPAPAPAPAIPALPPIVGGDEDPPERALSSADALPFVLIYSPGDCLLTDDGPVPRVIEQRLQPGLGGVSRDKRGQWHMSGLSDDVRQAGRRILPLALGYCVQAIPGTDLYRPAWGEVRDGRIVEDPIKRTAFVARLVAEGHLPPPSRRAVERAIDDLEKIVEVHPSQGGHSLTIDTLRRRIAAARAYLETL